MRRLLEYERIKLAAHALEQHPQKGRDFLAAQIFMQERTLRHYFPEVCLPDLVAAWAEVVRRAKLTQHHTISREQLSVREHMSLILKRLQSVKFVEFSALFSAGPLVNKGIMQILVVHFIAMLGASKKPDRNYPGRALCRFMCVFLIVRNKKRFFNSLIPPVAPKRPSGIAVAKITL